MREENNNIRTDNDEIRALQKEVLGKLDNPLVVHKKSDASYAEDVVPFEMNETHNEEEAPTLVRHRFRKEKKKNNSGSHLAVLFFMVILAAVFSGLYFTGNISFHHTQTQKTTKAQEEVTTSLQEKYAGKIVVKDTYIFVNGEEVSGIEGLQAAIEYETPSTTAYEIIAEHANADFLNYGVLPLLDSLKFYGEDTVITHVESTGLMAAAELTTLPPETTAPPAPETTAAPAPEQP